MTAACGGGGGGGDIDAQAPDAPVNVPLMITISGTATEPVPGGAPKPIEGATVGAFKATDETTPVVMTTTDAQGNYSLTIPTGGMPVDGFIKATSGGHVDVYLYAPAPLVADFSGASLNLLTTNLYGLVAVLCRENNQDAAKGLIGVLVEDAVGGTPVAGAKVAADPATTKDCYNNGGTPDSTQMATADDGIAILFNMIDNETVSATKSGATFKSHAVKAFAGAFTTTLITQ